MTAAEYWDKDCELVKAYRKAQQLRDERTDAGAWLMGKYVYDALCRASPLFHDFVKGEPKPVPYMEKPYMELLAEQRRMNAEQSKEIRKKNGMMFMMQYTQRFNARRTERQMGDEKQ